ncbi:MAG: tRNA (adenosine(37)-N6)-dimethylallyltransferase MiaA [Pseudomonadota bacterium]
MTLAPLLVIVGPTASGKTEVALRLAERIGAEIISADSVQVYRGLDIGSAKPTVAEQAHVRHHLLDVAEPDEQFDAARFRTLAAEAIADIQGRGKAVVVAGGTGLYIRALLGGLFQSPPKDPALRLALTQEARQRGRESLWQRLAEIDPAAARRIHPRDLVRVIRALEVSALAGRPLSQLQAEHGFGERPYRYVKIGLLVERPELYRRIEERVGVMLAAGWLDETRRLLERHGPAVRALQALGYFRLVACLQGRLSIEEARRQIVIDTRRYAKRQLVWFRADPEITWLRPDDPQIIGKAEELLAGRSG